jgi:hypothetical protein
MLPPRGRYDYGDRSWSRTGLSAVMDSSDALRHVSEIQTESVKNCFTIFQSSSFAIILQLF